MSEQIEHTRPISPRPATYRGCTPINRRRGIVRTTRTADVVRIRRARRALKRALPPPSSFVNLELEADAYAGVACWSGGPARWAHVTVPIAYELRYKAIRPQMCNGGIDKHTLVLVAAALARFADFDTGRNSRPSNTQLALCTCLSVRTVQRARECLRLLGVATEVLRGRQRTLTERMASWRMGDRHRGWASVWALHDLALVNKVIHSLSSHLGRSHFTTETTSSERTLTTRGRAKRTRHGASRRRAPDKDGLRLATQWRASPGAPRWCQRYSADSWAAMLAAPAAAGWNARDLTQLVRDWLGTGRRISDSPPRPIALLGTLLAWHLSHNTLLDRPAALDEAREAAELAAVAERKANQAQAHVTFLAEREQGRAALASEGHAWARREAARLAKQSAGRRTEAARRDHEHRRTTLDTARQSAPPRRIHDGFLKSDADQ
ncbi:helix-turn-helix domain-containing protein [Mycolicibacterium wolinskyi]|uniref:helix-turn-helix domain-containing protein n=1 Tax=Mycolicibacterium wolinskyi TaxID=59750 RepID=UPI000AB4BA12|nr:helix-turn-helix domain-containing protein [Mycolicibacterium wolinskyi]